MTLETGGQLIVVEGPDMFGKTTQIARLKNQLEAEGNRVETLHFPTSSTKASVEINRYLRGELGSPETCDVREISRLFFQDREEVAEDMFEKLRQGATLLVSRFWPSTLVYQSIHLPEDKRMAFWRWCRAQETSLPLPQHTLILSGDVDVAYQAALSRSVPDRLEGTGQLRDVHESSLDLQRLANKLYGQLAQMHDWPMVEATSNGAWRSPEAITQDLIACLVSAQDAQAVLG